MPNYLSLLELTTWVKQKMKRKEKKSVSSEITAILK